MFKNKTDRYASSVIFLHWFMLLVIVSAYTLANIHNFTERGTAISDWAIHWHMICGVSILTLVIIRIVLRLVAGPRPAIAPTPKAWVLGGAKLTHLLLYAFMLTMPMLAWSAFTAADNPMPLGLPHLPFIEQSKDLARAIFPNHVLLGRIGYFLFGLHALAALYHHYVVKDNTVRRIWKSASK